VLTMRGSRDEPDNPSEDRYRRQERPQGTWQRSLTVPDRVDHEKLTAEFNNGILKIHLPKSGEAKRRQIPVTEGPH